MWSSALHKKGEFYDIYFRTLKTKGRRKVNGKHTCEQQFECV